MRRIVRELLGLLTADAVMRLFDHTEVGHVELRGLGRRSRASKALTALDAAGDETYGRVEAIAGHLQAFADRGEVAEQALWSLCLGAPELEALLDLEAHLAERTLMVWLHDPAILDRARNVMWNQHWHGSRYHKAFKIATPLPIVAVDRAAVAIQEIVRQSHGGRQVHLDAFTYPATDPSGERSEPLRTINHIAVYLETPARFVLEFRRGKSPLKSVLRRETRELAIDYDAGTGQLDIGGRAVGGGRVLDGVAEAFRDHALDGAVLTRIETTKWALNHFLSTQSPQFAPPVGCERVVVAELTLRSPRREGATASFNGGIGGSAYDRMRELGVDAGRTGSELVSAVALDFHMLPEPDGVDEHVIRTVLRWPGQLSCDGTPRERKAITKWLETQPFAKRTT